VEGMRAAGALGGPLDCVALSRNTGGPAAQALSAQGLGLVQGDLDDQASLSRALQGVDMVYCHALSKDAATADPAELARARRLAAAAKEAGVKLVVYNSSAGKGVGHGISQAEQKNQIEDIIAAAGVPLTALQATLFMEELWKRYTRPGILKGTFTWSTPSDKPLQLLAARDLGLAAGYVLQDPGTWSGRALELAGDELTPAQMCDAFSKAQGGAPVRHSRPPLWPFWLLNKDLWRIAKFYSEKGYSADVAACRAAFPGMLTFEQFLQLSGWGDASRDYDQGISFAAAAQPAAPAQAAAAGSKAASAS